MARWPERIYRALLAVYPAEFRDEFGAEMTGAFRAQYRAEGNRGWRFWTETIADISATAWKEQTHVNFRDLKLSYRRLKSSPGFLAVAVGSLALGIGLNAAIFSLVYAAVYQPLPYKDADRMVMLSSHWKQRGTGGFSSADLLDCQRETKSFERMALYTGYVPFTMTGAGPADRVVAQAGTPELYEMLGVQPVIGRLFSHDDLDGKGGYALLSHRFWQRRFGGDAGVLGKLIRIDGEPRIIVGVMPPGYRVMDEFGVDLWHSIDLTNPVWIQRASRWTSAMAKLRPGVTRETAQQEMTALAAGLEQRYPDTNRNMTFLLESRRQLQERRMGAFVFLLFGAVSFVLLIACANVASLLLARATTRRREIAVRASLGAGRNRLIRELLADGFALALPGTLLGIAIAYAGARAIVGLSPEPLPFAADLRIDTPVLFFLAAVGFATAILVGLAPAWQASKTDLMESMKEGARGTVARAGQRMRGALVAAEIALALILLVGAGLMVNTVVRIQKGNLGFDPSRISVHRFEISGERYKHWKREKGGGIVVDPRVDQLIEQVHERILRIPGVESAALTSAPPLRGGQGVAFLVLGRPRPEKGSEPFAMLSASSAGYFETLKIPLVRGRYLDQRDEANTPWTVVINQAAADQYWPREEPLGQFVQFQSVPAERPRQIVGVVRNVRHFFDRDIPLVYAPYAQQTREIVGNWQTVRFHPNLVVRSRTNIEGLTREIREVIASIDPDQPVYDSTSMDEVVRRSGSWPRFLLFILGFLAFLALVLAASGIYGLMSYSVTDRRQEIGIRMALGAGRSRIVWLITSHGLRLTAIGIVLGSAGAFAASKALQRFLFGITPSDPVTYAAVGLLIFLVALAGCYLPARKAAGLDPATTLRAE